MKILFCCHLEKLHDYFDDISQRIDGHETAVIDLPGVEQDYRGVRANGDIPWSRLWRAAGDMERSRCIRRGPLYLRRYWQWLPLSALRRARQLFLAYSAVLQKESADAVCLWGAKYRPSLMALAARSRGLRVIYLENGVLPFTTAVDPQGINAGNSLPRDPGFYRALTEAPAPTTPAALEVRRVYPDKPGQDAGLPALPKRYIFAPFQVDSDTQILLQSPWIRDMRRFFRVLVEAFRQLDDPELHLIFKEHPSSASTYPDLHREADRESRIHFVNNRLTQELIEQAERIVTINSSVGIESLLFDRPVIVTGRAFYSIPDLVLQADSEAGLLQALRASAGFRSDPRLRRSFLHYLETEYLVPGKKFDRDEAHLRAMAARITRLLEGGESADQAHKQAGMPTHGTP